VERTLAASGFLAVVVNLQHVRYVNSAGMAYLVGLADRLEAAGGGLHLANPQPKVRVVLDLMGLSGFLRLHATVEAAVRAARPRGPGRPLRRGSPA
jgi:anti-anti-sigma factor